VQLGWSGRRPAHGEGAAVSAEGTMPSGTRSREAREDGSGDLTRSRRR
jgi:hypothetical protein